MRKTIIITLAVLFALAWTGDVQAQNCNQGVKLAKKTWQQWGPWKPQISLVPFKNKVKKLKNAWNWIAANGGANIGPRFLEIDASQQQGVIMGQTKRTFVTNPSFADKVEITVNKYDGRARTGLVICVMGKDGVTTQKVSYTFPNSRNGAVKKFVLRNVRGKVIIIAMKNHSVGNKFKYRIKAVSK